MISWSVLKIFRTSSIINKLTLWFSLSLFIIFTIATAFLYLALSNILLAEDTTIIHDKAEAISNILRTQDEPLSKLKQRIEFEWATRKSEKIFIKIVAEKDHQVLVVSPQYPAELDSEVFSRLTASNKETLQINGYKLTTSSGDTFLGIAKIIESRRPQFNHAILYAALDLRSEQDILTNYRNAFAAVLVGAALISVLFGIRLAKLSFKPVEDIIQTSRKIRSSNLHERIDESPLPAELKILAKTINEMLDRLGESFDRLSRFSADLAHELRTPINNIQGEIEVALRSGRSNDEYKEVIFSVLEEIGRIAKMIDRLLFLARSENPAQHIQLEEFNLKEEIVNICDFYQATAEDEGIQLQIEIADDHKIYCDRALFQRALTNLLSNSINHTAKGGQVCVRSEKTENHILVAVTDSGSGIAAADLPKIFDRFYRADSSRTATKLGGFGLGLTIVQSIMRLHRGDVSVESQLGVGTKVTLSFPYAVS